MLVLLTVNVRLLRSPTADGKRSIASDPARSEFSYPARANSASPQGKACSPAITDEDNERSGRTDGRDDRLQLRSKHRTLKMLQESGNKRFTEVYAGFASPEIERATGAEFSRKKSWRQKNLAESQAQKSSQPSDKSPKRYTVQVGAFTSPQMAEEQALHWKSLGYKTLLRPAAMPKAGIVYRLYLGSFQSEREADNLVRDLKAKGVSSFSAVVSN